MWYALWHGGYGAYSESEMPRDLEKFQTLEQAKREFKGRFEYGSDNTFRYVDGRVDHSDTPAVAKTCRMELFGPIPNDIPFDEIHFEMPDRVLKFGPRGGIHVSY